MVLQQLIPAPAIPADFSQTGRWQSSTNVDVAGTHVVLLREPQSNAAKVFLFGESGYAQKMRLWRFFASDSLRLPSLTYSGDSASVLDTLPHPVALSEDLFCSGHTVMADGRMLLLGGSWTPPSPCGQVYALDPAWFENAADPWSSQASMAVERWYATATALPNGKVLATAGTAHSTALGFGGDTGGSSYSNKHHPLWIAGRFTWADTTVVPSNNPPADSRVRNDYWTAGKWPEGRDGHELLATSDGRAILIHGAKKATPRDVPFDDVWLLENSATGDDSTHTWRRMPIFGDHTLSGPDTVPAPRHHFAATWAGVEHRAASLSSGALVTLTCYIHGGIDANGNVLGDLWKGEKFNHSVGYKWVWTRLMAGDSTTARYGHTMSFDPGPHFSADSDSAGFARLVILGGGWHDSTVRNIHLYTYGVGKSGVQADYHAWRETNAPGAVADSVPEAREGHAATVKQTVQGDEDSERQIYIFGGQRANGSVVSGGLWYLNRPDAAAADTALLPGAVCS